jgi:hypothetical protein
MNVMAAVSEDGRAVGGSMAEVLIESDIPADHPHKEAIESAFVAVTGELDGSWTLTIRRDALRWWAVSLEGHDLVLRTLFHDIDLCPERIRERWLGIFSRHAL